jgi:threonine/homoserine/homoserine lactone efflux protein
VLGTFSAGAVQIPLVVLGLAAVFKQSPALFMAARWRRASRAARGAMRMCRVS